MNPLLRIAAVVTLLSGWVLADPEPTPPAKEGTIVKIEGATVVLACQDAPGKDKNVPVITDAKTEVTLDGKPAKVADLKVGMAVAVTARVVGPAPESGPPSAVAVKIVAKTAASDPRVTSATTQPANVLTLDLGKKVMLKLVEIPAGKFMMGGPAEGRDPAMNEGPQHEVTISKPFYLGVYEVMQEQYELVVGKNPSEFKDPSNPVEQVSWNDAVAFCKRAAGRTGKMLRLPTEAEWEFACRAGSKTRFNFGDDESQLGDYAWHWLNTAARTHPVGLKKPNGFGLYDMHGNVSEWCSDWYAESYVNAKNGDPQGPDSGTFRVQRGNSYMSPPNQFRSAWRSKRKPEDWNRDTGFRVALDSRWVPQAPGTPAPPGPGTPAPPGPGTPTPPGPGTPAPPGPAAKVDLNGAWEVTWRTGRKTAATIKAGGGNLYEVALGGDLEGTYEVKGDKLIRVGTIKECIWRIKDADNLVLVTAPEITDLVFDGITLSRQK